MNCNNFQQVGGAEGIVPGRISIAVLRVFKHQMACLHPAVSSSGGRARPHLSWLAPAWCSRACSDGLIFSALPNASVLLDLYTLRSAPEKREREMSVAGP